MVSGESLTAGIMYDGDSTDVVWDKSMIAGGNYVLQTTDNAGGRFSRRILNFPFKYLVPEKHFIDDLARKIVADELMWVFIRLAQQYKRLRDLLSGKRLKTLYPESLTEFQKESAETSNPLLDFITNGSGYYRMLRDPDALTPIQDLRRYWNKHCDKVLKEKGLAFNADESLFAQAGLEYKRMHVCDEGGTLHECVKTACGDHYDRSVARRVWVVKGLRIQINPQQPSAMDMGLPDDIAVVPAPPPTFPKRAASPQPPRKRPASPASASQAKRPKTK